MDNIKRYLGIIWMLTGPVLFIFLMMSAVENINGQTKGDISNPLPWVIILAIFLPIAIGFSVFGWYAFKEDYKKMDD